MLSPSDFNNAVPQFTNGNYASNPTNPQYIAEPDAKSYNRGTEPLQTLPAQWWNWFINKFTARFNKVNIYVKNIFNELAQVLSIFNIKPDGTEQTPTTSQLKTVFETCYPQYVKTHTTGTAVGCIPTVGTALGTTNNNILVTDSTGKLKPSGITVGTAAGCDATLFARKTEIDALYGNIAGTALGTSAVGTSTTFARSDHVHPMPTCVACAGTTSYLYTTSVDGIFTDENGNLRHKSTCVPNYWHVDRYDGTPVLGVYFEQNYVCAPLFCGNLNGNATTTSYLNSPGQFGVCSDCNGNLHQKEFLKGANYQIFDYQNNPVMRVFFSENYVCAATFCGNLSGTATCATNDSNGNAINTTYAKKSNFSYSNGVLAITM